MLVGGWRLQTAPFASCCLILKRRMLAPICLYVDYSFSGTRPLRGVPERGVLFEKYTSNSGPPSPIQALYLRPTQDRSAGQPLREAMAAVVAPQQLPSHRQNRGLSLDGNSAKVLPNGVPRARLDHLHALQTQGRSRAYAQQVRLLPQHRLEGMGKGG